MPGLSPALTSHPPLTSLAVFSSPLPRSDLNASPDMSGSCVCNPSFYSVDGAPPGCKRCPQGAQTVGAGSTACVCAVPTGSSWDATSNTCACPNGTASVNGVCLKANGARCSAGSECASALCDHGACATTCATGAPDGSGGCGCAQVETRCVVAGVGGCYNLKSNPDNCGTCGNTCPQNSECQVGPCMCWAGHGWMGHISLGPHTCPEPACC